MVQTAQDDGRQPNTGVARNGDPYGSNDHNATARVASFGTAPRQVPMEIDLNEFMLDTDFNEFLGGHFDINPSH